MTEVVASSYRDIGLFNLLGIEMTHSEEGVASGAVEIDSRHRNRAGSVHGGVFCTLIDFAACAAGLHAEPGQEARYAVTLSLTTQFTKAVDGGKLEVKGRLISAGRKTFTAEAHVYDEKGAVAAHGIGTFQWRPGSEPMARTKQTSGE